MSEEPKHYEFVVTVYTEMCNHNFELTEFDTPRGRMIECSNCGATKYKLESRETMTTYPVGTKISAIRNFDRSTKVLFTCSIHGGAVYASKQPSCSTWFWWNNDEPGIYECSCTMHDDVWITTAEYTA